MSASSNASFRENFLADFQDRLQDRVDGLCLMSLGGFLAALARSRHYWNFLNPKFSHLSLGTGVVLVLCGLALVLKPEPGRTTTTRLLRQVFVLGFLCLAATAWDLAAREPEPGGLNPVAAEEANATAATEQEAPAPPRVTKNGVEYQRLNLAELYIMLDKGRTDYPRHFALRAVVGHAPGLDQRSLSLLTRTAVVCCLADSLELNFLTQGLDGVASGTWVEVFGHLEPLADKAALKAAPKGRGPSLRIVNPKFRIVADAVEPITPPSFPYLFEFREKEPFAW